MLVEEELFEINQKISQIRNNLLRRQEKMSELSLSYQKILQKKSNPSSYLTKKPKTYTKIKQSQLSKQEQLQLLKTLVLQSRSKINNHPNQLKQLHNLIQIKNHIRHPNHKQNISNQKIQNKRQRNNQQKFVNQTQLIPRTTKDRINPFSTMKVQKFLDFYQQIKKQREKLMQKQLLEQKNCPKLGNTFGNNTSQDFSGNKIDNEWQNTWKADKSLTMKQNNQQGKIQPQEQQSDSDSLALSSKELKILCQNKNKQKCVNNNYQCKFPGIGAENTLFFATIKSKQPKKQQTKGRKQKKRVGKDNITDKMKNQLKLRPKILGFHPTKNFFEDKMKRILKWHGSFWQKDCQLL